MPSGRINQTLYTGPGNIESMNTTTLYKPGELGSQIQVGQKAYQLIQLDSGALATTAAGVPLAGQIAFWKDKTKYLVTNDRIQAQGGVTNSRNLFAGVFCATTFGGAAGTASLTGGNYGVVQQRGPHVGVWTNASTLTSGLVISPSTSGTLPDTVNVAVGTAPGAPVVGIATAANGAVTAGYTPATLGGWDNVDTP